MTMPPLPPTGDTTNWDADWALEVHNRASGNLAAGTPSARSIGTGALEAAAGNHTHTSTPASETVVGPVELATAAETTTGTDNTRAVHPAGLKVELDKKQSTTTTQTTQTGATYTFVIGDSGTVVEGNSATAQTFTVPPNSSVAFAVGASIVVRQYGAGQITMAPGAAVTLRSRVGLKTAGQYAELVMTKRATDEWICSGDTST